MSRTRTFALGACLVLAAAPVAAQEAPRAISLDEAVEMALRHDPTLAQADGQLRTSASAERSAWGAFLPSMSMSTGASRSSTERFNPQTNTSVSGSQGSYSAGLNASYDVFTGGRRLADLKRTRAQSDAAQASFLERRYAAALSAKRAFFDVLRASELIGVAELRLGLADQGLQAAEQRLKLGSATRSDVLRAELERNRARQALLSAQNQKRTASFALGRTVGVDGAVEAEAGETLAPEMLEVDRDALYALVLERAPSVRAAEASARAANAGFSAARAQYLPSLSLSSGYDWFNQQPNFADARGSWSLRLGLSYPIFNRFQREDAVARADVQADVARAQLEDARLGARAELERVLGALDLAEQSLALTEEAVRVADEDMRVQQERYRLGASTILDQLTSQVARFEAENDRVAARYDYQLARAELEALIGGQP